MMGEWPEEGLRQLFLKAAEEVTSQLRKGSLGDSFATFDLGVFPDTHNVANALIIEPSQPLLAYEFSIGVSARKCLLQKGRIRAFWLARYAVMKSALAFITGVGMEHRQKKGDSRRSRLFKK